MSKREPLIFEMSVPGRKAYSLPACDVPEREIGSMIPAEFLRGKSPELPEVSEVDAVRHFTGLSRMNHGVDSGFYPLGSCTMKTFQSTAAFPGCIRISRKRLLRAAWKSYIP